jgi:glycosyltransferase involved in cell wall biosynthesis
VKDAGPQSARRLRLVHCCGQFAANQGGTERQARAVCEALAARGHQVSVLTRRGVVPAPAVPGVAVHETIRALDRGRLFGVTYTASATLALLRRAGTADCLHAYHLYLDAAAALLAGRVRRRPVVAKMTGAGPGGDLDRLRHTAGGTRLLARLRTLDAVIAPSATCRAELLAAGFPAERVRVIANGVDTARFRPGGGDDSILVPIPWSGPMIVFAGRLIEAKGVLELLEAWPRVLGEVPESHLVVLGSGPLESALRRLAQRVSPGGRVHLVGEVSDVRPYLRAASGFVLPSWAEGLPNSLLEAMAMGLPCVTTDIGSIRDAVEDGREGLLVPAKAPERLAVALTVILTQPELRGRLGRAARMRVEEQFSLERTVDLLEALYRELVPGCGPEAGRG